MRSNRRDEAGGSDGVAVLAVVVVVMAVVVCGRIDGGYGFD